MRRVPSRCPLCRGRECRTTLRCGKLSQHDGRDRPERLHSVPCGLGMPHRRSKPHAMRAWHDCREHGSIRVCSVCSWLVPAFQWLKLMRFLPGGQPVHGARDCAYSLQPGHVCGKREPEHLYRLRCWLLPVVQCIYRVLDLSVWIILPSGRECADQLWGRHLSKYDGRYGSGRWDGRRRLLNLSRWFRMPCWCEKCDLVLTW